MCPCPRNRLRRGTTLTQRAVSGALRPRGGLGAEAKGESSPTGVQDKIG